MFRRLSIFLVSIFISSAFSQVVIKDQKDGVEHINQDPNRGNEVRGKMVVIETHQKMIRQSFFPQPRLARFQDRVQRMTILAPRPHGRSPLLWVS